MTALAGRSAFSVRRLAHAEAISLLNGLAAPVKEREEVGIYAAAGRVGAEIVLAPRSSPAHNNSAVDGYAFAFDDYDGKSGAILPIAGRIAAGDAAPSRVPPGCAARIFTGAVMPEGCDTVAMQEDCRVEGGDVLIAGGLKKGVNRRLAGEDMVEGTAVIAPGQRLRPQDVAALAACGLSKIVCVRRPRLQILSTGNEVLAAGAPFALGKVYDANGPMLAGLFSPLGVSANYGGILPDRFDDVQAALRSAAAENDLIVTSGGASLGEEDHVIAALKRADALDLWQLAIKPGRPMGVGRIGSCLCFALPGNPVAAMVCALLYVWPVARRLAGEPWIEPRRFFFPAGFEIRARRSGRREFLRGWLERAGDRTVARSYPRDGSGLISSLRAASGLIEIPEDVTAIQEGDEVAFVPFSEFGILANAAL
ncbi:MAG: gephyrin-like molybdotransferase Glp [Roseiarcus sp.]|jgi:molybdopterin molybdotransferase